MAEAELRQIAQDIAFIKERVVAMGEEIEEISTDIHRIRPEYLERLKKIEKGKFHSYNNIEELRKDIEK